MSIHHDELIVFTDGGSRGNPGPAASGMIIMDEDRRVIESRGVYLGRMTNNQAEWRAVKFALEMVEKYSPDKITFYMDSELVCRQLNGIYRVKNVDIMPVYLEVVKMATKYKVSYHHVYRADNKLADAEVNKAIDAALSA